MRDRRSPSFAPGLSCGDVAFERRLGRGGDVVVDILDATIHPAVHLECVRAPLDGLRGCIALVCSKLLDDSTAAASLAGLAGYDGTPQSVSLRMLIKSGTAGRVIGREGAGLRSLRALGVSVDLPREEHLPGERVCTINGPPLAVAQAVASVCEAQVS